MNVEAQTNARSDDDDTQVAQLSWPLQLAFMDKLGDDENNNRAQHPWNRDVQLAENVAANNG